MTSTKTLRPPKIWRRLDMPNGDVITVAARYADGELMNHHDDNHNVYRLTAQGDVLWQVQRDDGGRWHKTLKLDRLEGKPLTHEPFQIIKLLYPDGSTNVDPQTGSPPDEAVWTPGCVVRLSSWDGWFFILDVDTGIATDITPRPHRPW